MKTKVKVLQDVYQSQIKAGDEGYIDGYVRAADARAYAAVVVPVRKIVDFCPLYSLMVLSAERDMVATDT